MNRREALKSLTALAGAAGITVTPVTTLDVGCAPSLSVVILRSTRRMSSQQIGNLLAAWEPAVKGTCLEGVKTIVLDEGMQVDVVRGSA